MAVATICQCKAVRRTLGPVGKALPQYPWGVCWQRSHKVTSEHQAIIQIRNGGPLAL